jgi:hypothetical protein
LVASRQRIDDGAGVRMRGFACEAVEVWLVVEAAGNAADVSVTGEAMEHLIDSVARAEVEKVLWRPDGRYAS